MLKNTSEKMTVVIPTRERCDTLEWCLKTCVSQDYDNCEILVSDNFSQDGTRDVVASFQDARIRYVQTGQRLSMSDNWEFALSHVSAGYVTYIGDDDGLLPRALADLNTLLQETGTEAISWKQPSYAWPSCTDENRKNYLVIYLNEYLKQKTRYLKKCDSKQILRDVVNLTHPYTELPWLYSGLVSYQAIQRVTRKAGRFFWSIIPDIYSGIALACVLDGYFFSLKPFSLGGASHHSNGMSSQTSNSSEAARLPFQQWLSENTLSFHPQLVLNPAVPVLVAESALQAKDHLGAEASYDVDMKRVIKETVQQGTTLAAAQYEALIETVREIGRLNSLEEFAQDAITAGRNDPSRPVKPVPGLNIFSGAYWVDCAARDVSNIYEAANLCGQLLGGEKASQPAFKDVVKSTLGQVKRQMQRRGIFAGRQSH